ncbi:hypothetical protein PKHYL_01170 [Psychrobacter sp. KH172YL61]|nr:hypothetical protein PKHYL_01170 [Psychrobacter sp. KH172YL61]
MRASLGSSKKSDDKNDDISTSVVVKKGGKASKATVEVKPKEQPKKKVAATKPKVETAAERKAREAREAEEARLREIEAETRRKQAEEAQKRTLEQMRKMAGKYTDREPVAEVRKDEPLAEGLVGDALEESFEKNVAKSNAVQTARVLVVVVVRIKMSVKSKTVKTVCVQHKPHSTSLKNLSKKSSMMLRLVSKFQLQILHSVWQSRLVKSLNY